MRYRLYFVQLLLLLSVALHAYDRTAYYQGANGKSGAALKTALYNIVGNPSVKSYNSLWTYYYDTDRLSDNQVVDRYSNTKRYFKERGDTPSGMNKEHGIPQSWWGGGTSGIGADLQHVMPSESDANSRKSNYGMGVVTNQTWTNGSIKVGKGSTGSKTIQMWEPADEWKGDFARAYFYIVTAYEGKNLTSAEGSNSMENNTYPKLQQWAYELYIKWSFEDPVDDLERTRNETVYGIQGNRNPFVDFPGLERYIWGDRKTTSVDLANYESPTGGETQISATAEFALESKSLIVGDAYQQLVTTNSNGEVTYTSSNTNVATVEASTGLVTAKAVGTTVITASVAATSTYRSAQARYTVIVTGDGDDPHPADGTTYVRLDSSPADWAGTYLIVYEGESVAMNGGLAAFDQSNNTIPVDISQHTIAVSEATEKAEFIVTSLTDGKYSIRGKSGKYMGCESSSNSIETSATALPNTLSVSSGEASIVGTSGYALRFNTQKGQKRFRYYKSGQASISLYRRTETADGIGQLSETTEGETAGDALNQPVYDLTGRRVSADRLTPGIYIIKGRKVLVK